MNHITQSLAIAAFTLAAPMAFAGNWTLDSATSNLSFGSVKSEFTGESHSFQRLTGTVSESGAVEIVIDLSSVETQIDIRNTRMIEHLFQAAQTATLSAQIDMDTLNALPVGGSEIQEVSGTVDFLGQQIEVDAEMFVMRLSAESAMVTTNGLVFLDLDEAGLSAGIDTLMELAGLDSITRASPVTMRLMFTLGEDKA